MLSPLLAALALLQFVAMAFLVIACLTAPVFHQIGLGKKSGTTYGVFGYCETISGCSSAKAQYNVPDEQAQGDNWAFSKHSRTILGHMLIATPVAAGLNFFAFLSLMMTLVSTLMSRDGNIRGSAFAFFVNLFFTALSFLASAFVCFVVFFSFWPHTTWITWLTIPAAALPLLEVPLVFLAHSRGSLRRGSKEVSDEDSDEEAVNMLPQDQTSFAEEKPLVLPDYNRRQEPVFKIDTASSDHSWKEKQAADERTRELSREHSFDNSYDNSYDHSIDHPHSQEEPQQVVSAIRSESRPGDIHAKHTPSISLSVGSSEYSEPVAHNTDSRAVLEDIIKDTLGEGAGTQLGSHPGSDHQDAESSFTSISQRAAARSAGPELAAMGMQQRSYQQQHQHPPMQALPGQRPMYRGVPAPRNMPMPQGYAYGPQQYSSRPHTQPRHAYRRPNGYMMPPRLAQQHGQPHPIAQPRPMVGQRPYQGAPMGGHPMQMGRSHQMAAYPGASNMSPPMAGGPMPTPNTATGPGGHYAPAYKKRMSAKNPIPSAAALNNTYGFR
ncbi:DCV1 (YFR012W) and YOL019W [Zygosaccharomyces parabailii]|uniref:ZYBA0S13-02102g1_1 n=1 Tax=Zygosaccharomyces bailii (strain CLIB 213 / ATCC 58445 / CBS 680 / BCRC 21525 / NBRC 1098 / NCYC 1416 / NRRL Y-2227) TaxID=1333698 RepID=A0A8J2TBB7_ZYGB2|nr:DCV1 (YFR012W) and YOL019W [Zygosaccharomyces parabailii]CDF91723.1 ZYBA0S13-02102g1_1 [Zygosaccharomyces bailii CLIB 213]CDH12332.1 uncharacterized protein ZBAI_04118 [Zygosaccharomyces bailii ISA1307]SJM87614.1 uncharacterized protein ZBIST_3803 [Zygosaccharomyces bailii]